MICLPQPPRYRNLRLHLEVRSDSIISPVMQRREGTHPNTELQVIDPKSSLAFLQLDLVQTTPFWNTATLAVDVLPRAVFAPQLQSGRALTENIWPTNPEKMYYLIYLF